MPVIRTYRRQVAEPADIRTERVTPEQMGAGVGRATQQAGGALVGAAGTAYDIRAKKEVSDLTAKMTAKQAELTKELDLISKKAKPGDSEPFEEFEKRAKEQLDDLGGEYSSRAARSMYQTTAARIQAQLGRTSYMAQSELAGIKAVQDHQDTLNNISATVQSDPSSLKMNLDTYYLSVDTLVESGQIDRVSAMKLKEDGERNITRNSVQGWINLDPEYAKKKLDSGEYDEVLGGDGIKQMHSQADQAIRAKELEKERIMRLEEKARKQKQKEIQNDFLNRMSEEKLTMDDVLKSDLDAFGLGSKKVFMDILAKKDDPKSTNPQTFNTLFNRIHLPDGDPNKIVDENELNQYMANGLSFEDFKKLRNEVMGKGTEAGRIEGDLKKQILKTAEAALTKRNPLTGYADPVGELQYSKYLSWFMEAYRQGRKEGKSPRELLDPASKDYLGKEISQYTKSGEQTLNESINSFSTNAFDIGISNLPAQDLSGKKRVVPQRKQGEGIMEYKKRLEEANK